MTTVARPPAPQQLVSPVMSGVSWETYARLRRELDDAGSHIQITYDRGRMVLMSPTPRHDKWKTLFGQLVEALATHRNLPISGYGSTTWRREDLARGLEADECYYVQHAEAMRGKVGIDLTVDPAPDLAIEIEVTHIAFDKRGIYASLRVPELWSYDGARCECLHLQPGGAYAPARMSLAFPGFEPSHLHRFLSMVPQSLDSEIVQAFREWLCSDTK
jgi:Uma2 family endonuclease